MSSARVGRPLKSEAKMSALSGETGPGRDLRLLNLRCKTAESTLIRTERTYVAETMDKSATEDGWEAYEEVRDLLRSREDYAGIERLDLVTAGSGIVVSSA